MPPPSPIYTAANCRAAYQLNWSLALFWRAPPGEADWLDALKTATEADGVRILDHRFEKPGVSQFLVSTLPGVAPDRLVWSVKGRLQHLIGRRVPKAFQRNYGLRSVGSVKREVVEQYVASQPEHHRMADPRVQARLAPFQICREEVDLSQPCRSAHALCWYNLHVVLVNDGRVMELRESVLGRIREMILKASVKRGYRLSRGAIMPDHIHLALGAGSVDAPCDVALGYMNNLAFACGMKPVFAFGFYAGTFGEYDLGVTW